MANFKFVIGDKKESYQVEKPQADCPIMGKKLGDTFSAGFLGLEGYELRITGGSDKEGFPMRNDIEGVSRKSIVVTRGIGFRGKKGERVRKSIRGNTIASDIIQVNCAVVKAGATQLAELIPKKEKKEEEKK